MCSKTNNSLSLSFVSSVVEYVFEFIILIFLGVFIKIPFSLSYLVPRAATNMEGSTS